MGIFYDDEPTYYEDDTDDFYEDDTEPGYVDISDRVLLSSIDAQTIADDYGVHVDDVVAARRELQKRGRVRRHNAARDPRPGTQRPAAPRRPTRPRRPGPATRGPRGYRTAPPRNPRGVADHRRRAKGKNAIRIPRSMVRRILGFDIS